MLTGLRRHLTFSNVAAATALFVSVGGGIAWALAADSVRSRHIVDGQVRSKDLRDGGTKSVDIRDNTVKGVDIDEDSLGAVPNASLLSGLAPAQLEPDAFGRFKDAFVAVPNGADASSNPRAGPEDVLTLNVPAGNYFVIAKGVAVVSDPGSDGGRTDVVCRTFADGDTDDSALSVNSNDLNAVSPDSEAIATPIVMTVLARSSSAFTVHLACSDLGQNEVIGELKINAVAVDAVTISAG